MCQILRRCQEPSFNKSDTVPAPVACLPSAKGNHKRDQIENELEGSTLNGVKRAS